MLACNLELRLDQKQDIHQLRRLCSARGAFGLLQALDCFYPNVVFVGCFLEDVIRSVYMHGDASPRSFLVQMISSTSAGPASRQPQP
jgi:hypothetical protein